MRKKTRNRIGAPALARAGLLLLGCAVGPAAFGRDGNVFTPYASASMTFDDNLFRLPSDFDVSALTGKNVRGDVITSLQEGMRGDRFLGRQRLSFDVGVSQTRYRTNQNLNANLVNASGTWAWQLGRDLSGEIGSDYGQSLTGFADIRSDERNITSVRNDRATIDYKLHPDWHLLGGLSQATAKNSAASRAAGDFTAETGTAGVSFTPPSGNRVTLRIYKTHSDSPVEQTLFGLPITNNYNETAYSSEVYWQASGKSLVTGQLSYTRRHYGDFSQRDYNGPTGNLYWGYQATGKTLLSATLKREIGANFDVTDNYILTDTASLSASYQATYKTQLQARFDNKTRRYLGDPGFILADIQRRVDHSNTESLTLNYDVAWPLRVTTVLSHEVRTSNTAGFGYVDNSATVVLQFTW